MADLLERLKAAKTDEARQAAVFEHVIGELPEDVRDVATVLAVPHWFSPSILDSLDDKAITEHAARLEGLSLVVRQSENTFSFPDAARDLLLRDLIATQLGRFRDLSRHYSRIFLELESETPANQIESIYHSLGADPTSGGRRMLEYGLRLKSEPLFEWDALDRVVTNADEQDKRGMLDDE